MYHAKNIFFFVSFFSRNFRRRMLLLHFGLLLIWGCSDTKDDEKDEDMPEVDDISPEANLKGKGNNQGINPDIPKPKRPDWVYENAFKDHGLATFKSNRDLTNYLIELSKKTNSNDSFGKLRLRPNMNLWDKAMELVRIGSVDRPTMFMANLHPKAIYVHGQTGVFELSGGGFSSPIKFVIKYRLECEDLGNLRVPNSVIQEAWFMSQLADKGLTTPVLYFSDPVLNPRPVPTTGMKKLEKTSCSGSRGEKPIIRYLISEKTGNDLHDFMFNRKRVRGVSFTDRIKIAGQMIMYLERLHGLNVVHGDAHTGNWIIEKGTVQMIDFGRSKILTDPSELDPKECHSTSTSSSIWDTKWEMRGCPYSFRDDVIEAVFMIGIILHGIEIQKYVEYLVKEGNKGSEEHERIKNNAMFFEYKPKDGFVVDDHEIKSVFAVEELLAGADQEVVDTVRKQLEIVSTLSSDDNIGIAEKPDYEGIKKALGAIIFAVDGLRSDDFGDWFKLPTSVE